MTRGLHLLLDSHRPTLSVTAIVAALFGFWILVMPRAVWAIPAEYQMCKIGDTCVLGEFYYDDDYTPLVSGTTCVLDGRDSADDPYFTAQSMTGNSDGWYSHSFSTTGALEGIYPTTMCCTYSGDTQCIDKTFQMKVIIPGEAIDADDIATAVWSASASAYTNSRTLGGVLQNLPASIWEYSNRTLTDISLLVSQIWNFDGRNVIATNSGEFADSVWNAGTRTLTDTDGNEVSETTTTETTTTTNTANTGGSVNSTTINQIASQVEQISTLLNQLVEGSNTSTITSGDSDQSLQAKIEQTRDYLAQLFSNSESISSQVSLLLLSWPTMTTTELKTEFSAIAETIGSSSNSSTYDQSMSGMAGWLAQAWSEDLTIEYQANIGEVARLVSKILTELERGQKTDASLADLGLLQTALITSSITLGNVSSVESEYTLFGFLKLIQRVADTLALADKDVNQLINDWEQYSAAERTSTLDAITESVMAVNFLPKASEMLEYNGSKNDSGQNQAIRLKALIRTNQLLLTNSGGDPISMVWIEEGTDSIIFRSMVHNPSTVLPQTATISYHLPRELSENSIKSMDDSLNQTYDTEKDLLTISGSFALDSLETQFQQVVTEDFWVMSESELLGFKQQAADLLEALDGTSYFGQGATIKSDIDVTIDNLLARNSTSLTPEDRIITFRRGTSELDGVRQKLEKLKDLVTEATAKGSIFGFIGGVQAIAVWGIIVIVIAGFIFLTMYMRLLHRQEMRGMSTAVPSGIRAPTRISRSISQISPTLPLPHHSDTPKEGLLRRAKTHAKKPANAETKLFTIVFLALTASTLSAIVSGSVMESIQKATSTEVAKKVAGGINPSSTVIRADQQPTAARATEWKAKPIDAAVLGSTSDVDTASELGVIRVPSDNQVRLRNEPSTDAAIVMRLSNDKSVEIVEKVGEWYSVRLLLDGEQVNGWVHGEYVEKSID